MARDDRRRPSRWRFMRKVGKGVVEVAEEAADVGGLVIRGAGRAASAVGDGISTTASAIGDGVGTAASVIGDGLGSAVGAVGDVAGAAAEGAGGCLEGCAGCSAAIVVIGIPGIVLLGWAASSLIA